VFGTLWFLAAVAEAQRAMMRRALAQSIEYGDRDDEPAA